MAYVEYTPHPHGPACGCGGDGQVVDSLDFEFRRLTAQYIYRQKIIPLIRSQ